MPHDTGRSRFRSNSGFSQIQTNFARNSELSPDARLIGVLYAGFANSEGWAWPSVPTLMRMARIGRDRVIKAKKELLNAGLLEKDQRQRSGGRFDQVRYRVGPGILAPRKQVVHSGVTIQPQY
jgi:hypothetical protein